jgi:beta-apo-4'-carotenal oxygenase
LNKPRFETEFAEIDWLLNDIVFTTRNLHKWVKDEKAPDIDLQFKLMRPTIRKDPLGCVLVIGYVVFFCTRLRRERRENLMAFSYII